MNLWFDYVNCHLTYYYYVLSFSYLFLLVVFVRFIRSIGNGKAKKNSSKRTYLMENEIEYFRR